MLKLILWPLTVQEMISFLENVNTVLFDFEEKAKSVEWKQKNRKQWYVLFGINGFTDDLKKLAETRSDILIWL